MVIVLLLFLGLDSISGEIENPFGYDWNDLPLDEILGDLVCDIQQVSFHEHRHFSNFVKCLCFPLTCEQKSLSLAKHFEIPFWD